MVKYMNNIYCVISNEEIAYKTYKMVLYGDTSKIKAPGQFLNIKIDNEKTFLRRPISISDYDCNLITIIYKVFGRETHSKFQKSPYIHLVKDSFKMTDMFSITCFSSSFH